MGNTVEESLIREAQKLARLKIKQTAARRALASIAKEVRAQNKLVKTLKSVSESRDWHATGAQSAIVPEGK